MPQKSANDPAMPVQKQRFSIYTMMLVLSFIAICTGCTLLAVEIGAYVDQGKSFFSAWDASAAKVVAPPAN